jgi:hypothetical protein
MKNILLLTALLIISSIAFSQSVSIINYSQWSDPNTFQLSPSPTITGYGYYSDSLSTVYDNKPFYEYNNQYYCIESWADYYFWFTEKYSHLFEDPGVYSLYYLTDNDLGMASYIASNKYLGEFYPSLFQLDFEDNKLEKNRLSNDQYLAKEEKAIHKLEKQVHDNKSAINVKPITNNFYTPTLFKKEALRNKGNSSQNLGSKVNTTVSSPSSIKSKK